MLEERKERFQKMKEDRIAKEEEYRYEDTPGLESGITMQITETKTRSEKPESKNQTSEKTSPKNSKPNQGSPGETRNLMPGPGHYELPRLVNSAVWLYKNLDWT